MKNLANLHFQLESFREFANSSATDSQAAQMNESGDVVAASKTAFWISRKIGFASAEEVKTNNNKVRNALIAALKLQFEATEFDDLPETVRNALKGTWAEDERSDFEFNDNETAGSGKPLTKRRISAVIRAVEAHIKENQNIDTQISTSCMETSPLILNVRGSKDINTPIIESIMARLEEKIDGESLAYEKTKENGTTIGNKQAVRNLVTRFVREKLIYMGTRDANGNPITLAGLTKEFQKEFDGKAGVLLSPFTHTDSVNDVTGLLRHGSSFRNKFLAMALKEAVLKFNHKEPSYAFQELREPTPEERRTAQLLSPVLSREKSELNSATKNSIVNEIFRPTKYNTTQYSSDESFDATFRDISRGWTIKFGDDEEGFTARNEHEVTPEFRQAYKDKVRAFFGNNESLVRFFNGLSSQCISTIIQTEIVKNTAQNKAMMTRFAQHQLLPFMSADTLRAQIHIRQKESGEYEFNYTCSRTDNWSHVDSVNNRNYPIDPEKSCENITFRFTFSLAEKKTEETKTFTYTDGLWANTKKDIPGETHTANFNVKVESGTYEKNISLLPIDQSCISEEDLAEILAEE